MISGSGSGLGGGTWGTTLEGIAPTGEHKSQSWVLVKPRRAVSLVSRCVVWPWGADQAGPGQTIAQWHAWELELGADHARLG